MAINRFLQSSVQSGLPKFDSVWDGRSAVGSMEPISSITLSGTQNSVEFNNIPSTYTHLQLRLIARTNRTSNAQANFIIRFNGDSGSNYSYHQLAGAGDGGSLQVSNASSQTEAIVQRITGDSALTNNFGAIIVDILDYANTNKYKTIRALGGTDNNGSGEIGIYSGLWLNSGAISSMRFSTIAGSFSFVANSSFSLYGIK